MRIRDLTFFFAFVPACSSPETIEPPTPKQPSAEGATSDAVRIQARMLGGSVQYLVDGERVDSIDALETLMAALIVQRGEGVRFLIRFAQDVGDEQRSRVAAARMRAKRTADIAMHGPEPAWDPARARPTTLFVLRGANAPDVTWHFGGRTFTDSGPLQDALATARAEGSVGASLVVCPMGGATYGDVAEAFGLAQRVGFRRIAFGKARQELVDSE